MQASQPRRRGARASLPDYKQRAFTVSSFWPKTTAGRMSPACLGGPELDAGRSCVTLGVWSNGYVGWSAPVAGRSCITQGEYSSERSRLQDPGRSQMDFGPSRRRPLQRRAVWRLPKDTPTCSSFPSFPSLRLSSYHFLPSHFTHTRPMHTH